MRGKGLMAGVEIVRGATARYSNDRPREPIPLTPLLRRRGCAPASGLDGQVIRRAASAGKRR